MSAMSASLIPCASSPVSRHTFITAAGKAAAGLAATAALASLPAAPPALASARRTSSRTSTTLNFLTGLGGPDGQTMQALVTQFNKQHPTITVKFQAVGDWGTFYDKLLPALAGGTAPPVFTTHVQEMLYFQSKGLFAPLDDLFGPSLPESDFHPLPMRYVTYQGHIYGMPLDMHGWGWYMNPTLLRRAGLPLRSPNSAEELIDWSRLLTIDKKGHNGLSRLFDGGKVRVYGVALNGDDRTYLNTLWSFGGSTLSADGKRATLNTPQAREALTLWHDLIFKYQVCAKPAAYDPWVAYANNGQAMVPGGDWQRNWFLQYPNVARMAVFMPRFGATRVAWMSGHVLACPAGLSGDQKPAVYTFMRWLSGKGLQWTEGSGHIPARISQRKSKAVMNLWPQSVFGPELAQIGRIDQPSVVYFDVEDARSAEIDAALNGTTSVDGALSAAQERITKALAQA